MATEYVEANRDQTPLKRDTATGIDRVMVTNVDENGDAVAGGGGGGGDASAANQLTQITAEQAIQAAVEGTLTVDGSGVTQPVSGTVAATGPLTDTELRATPVPVSGTVTANVGTGTQAVDATGSGDVPVTLDGEAVVLGAGSAAIGKLAANSGVDIGDVDVTSAPFDTLTNIIESTAHDLDSGADGALSETSAVASDYRLDSIEMNWSTAVSRTVTVTTSDGTVIYTKALTAASLVITDLGMSFQDDEEITVAATATGSACLMDVVVRAWL